MERLEHDNHFPDYYSMASEEHFRTFLEKIPHIVWLANARGQIVYISQQLSEYSGEAINDGSLDEKYLRLIHQDDVAQTQDAIKRAIKMRSDFEVQQRIRNKYGEFRWHMSRGRPVLNDSGEILEWVGTITDIHEEKIAEERLALATSVTGIGVWDLDTASGKIWRTDKHDTSFGYECYTPEREADDFIEQIVPEDRERIRNEFYHAITTGSVLSVEYRFVKTDGEVRWMAVEGRGIRDESGKLIRYLGTNKDITERKVMEDERNGLARNQQKWLEALIDQLPISIALINSSTGNIQFINRAAMKQKFFIPPSGDEKVNYSNFALDSEGNRIPWKDMPRFRIFRGEEVDNFMFTWHTPQGIVPILMSGKRLPALYGRPSVSMLVYQDVSEQKRIETDLTHTVEKLKDSIDALDFEKEIREAFVMALSHDLRTPLTSAKMSSQILIKRASNPDSVHQLANRIINSINRADSMIRDLLDANRIKAGESLPLQMEKIDLGPLIEETIEDLSTVFGDRFIFNANLHIEARVSIDGVRRIVENLCSNAVKYGDSDHKIKVTLATEKAHPVISVHNFGNPIPDKELDHLFKLFRRGRSAEHSGHRGWGIGLTLVKGLVDAHNGSIKVTSSKEEGTIFNILL